MPRQGCNLDDVATAIQIERQHRARGIDASGTCRFDPAVAAQKV
jgi:hypothetical protein